MRLKTCNEKRKICKWEHVGHKCFRSKCCSTKILKGKVVVGSTKCIKGNTKCKRINKRKCSWIKSNNKCKTKRCCVTSTKGGKVISTKCKNVRRSCKLIVTRKCVRKQHKNGCKFKYCCKTFKKNGSIIYRRCEKVRGTCPPKVKSQCRSRKIGSCQHRSCCKFAFSYSKGNWFKLKRTCRTSKKCPGTVVKCRRIKLINNCYKTRCLTTFYKNGKQVGKKCEKSKKKFVYQK